MTDEEKQILLQDLCARLPYGVIVEIISYEQENLGPWFGKLYCKDLDCFIHDVTYKSVKPYLRPMSSMTEEEIEEYIKLRYKDCIDVEGPAHCCKNSITAAVVTLTSREFVRYWYNDMVSTDTIDFLNSRHFDWRGLIPMGLALEAKDEMYKTKTE